MTAKFSAGVGVLDAVTRDRSMVSGQQEAAAHTEDARRQIRGSSLLLVGRLFALGVNFAVQVLIVRSLSVSAYGAFAYALSVATMAELFTTFGLRRALERFVPIYDENRDQARALGAIVMTLGTILSLGTAMILLVVGLQGVIEGTLIDDRLAVTLLVILILLAPITALENLIDVLFAVYSNPRAIFFRKYVLAPSLRLTVVLLLVLTAQDVTFLALGYVAAGALGVVVYGSVLGRLFARRGLLAVGWRGMKIPARQLLRYSVPLFSTELFVVTVLGVDAIMLGYFHSTEEVAALRAVEPVARLNEIVLSAFALLFTPMAARLFARRASAAVNTLFWQSTTWIAVLSFPLVAGTVLLSRPLTVTLFGDEYAGSAVLLAVVSLGLYLDSALGLNEYVLQVYGRLRFLVVTNLTGAAANIGLNAMLIPRYGALGAAVATGVTLGLHALARQFGLRLGTGVRVLPTSHLHVYAVIAAAIVLIAVVEFVAAPPVVVSIALAAGLPLLLLGVARRSMAISETFPELLRFRVARVLLGER